MRISADRDLQQTDAAAGAALAVFGLLLVAFWPAGRDGGAVAGAPHGAAELVGYAVVWLPLGGAVLVASRWHGRGLERVAALGGVGSPQRPLGPEGVGCAREPRAVGPRVAGLADGGRVAAAVRAALAI